MITIVEAVNKKQMKLFATFPIKLYKNCKYYVPSIVKDEMVIQDGEKNLSKGTSACKCFLAYKGNKLVGRICGIINFESNKKFNEKCIRFNRIDFIDDIEVAKALIEAVMKYGLENGLDTIHGPWGFNDTDREGMLTDGFDQVSNYATNYSFPYYIDIMEKLGFTKESEWIEFQFDINHIDQRFHKIAEQLSKKGYRDLCDTMPLKKIIKNYGTKFFNCYNRSYADLDNFVPVEGESVKATLKQFGTILNRNYFSVIVDKHDDVVAFGVGLPYIGNVLRNAKGRLFLAAIPLLLTIKNPKAVELALIGVDPLYRNTGVHALVVDHFITSLKKHNIVDIFMDPVLTTNDKMLQTWAGMKKTIRQKRQTFRKQISDIKDC